ncbi:MAG: TlpA disulfide reductase family protein [Cryomorphaceae bacterium]
MKNLAILAIALLLLSCEGTNNVGKENRIAVPATPWRFSLNLNGDILPFNGTFSNVKKRSATLTLRNADEKIIIDDVILRNDSVIVELPFFNTEMHLRVESPFMLSGVWVNLDKDDYRIPLTAEQGQDFRFTNTGSQLQLPSKYLAKFELGTETEYPAVLLLENNSGNLTGTFLTETGDYRYLEGNIMNRSVYLSTFDGSHAFYFQAEIKGDSLVNGVFKSGKTYQTDWMAYADSTATLKNPKEITTIKSSDPIDFNLPNQDGEVVDWAGLDLEGKVVVLDIMGTWCPNCMDASKALKELARPYSDDDLVIVPVLFEYRDDLTQAQKAYSEYSEQLNIPENFLFGGRASKKVANEKFPMLSSIRSFPTLVFVGRDRQIAEVYTGFYGPGTGDYYSEFMSSTKELLARLVDDEQ